MTKKPNIRLRNIPYGSFYCTEDTYVEAERELENDGII